MSTLQIYCDTGGYMPQLRPYVIDGRAKLFQFRYDDNRNPKIKHAAVPTQPTFREMNYTWAELKQIEELKSLTWDDLESSSDKFEELKLIIGGSNLKDAKHVDSAYRAGCSVLLTGDKDDLWSKREQIFQAVGIRILHNPDDWPALEAMLQL
ncbi:hypothetical protein HZ993_02765 [Rhodoferax sp. AJA081-3]|uniref:hypothetical protein n=1 Tax=Rhodoferax sp. AJA081-3 TaxID=2752316 RepID=UPI001ADF1D19|nr:hypothetical protein [Rhodoferax sp. AJA081-3]QTN28788.1 hypothetical protein HZ993_02765 [Rhodoferax sp. AJA081-3]